MPQKRNGLHIPTIAERSILVKVKDDIPPLVWVVASAVFFERATFWGITAPLQNYMQNPPQVSDDQLPGALGLGQSTATLMYCTFYVFHYTIPIAIAILADSSLGRYKTLVISTGVYCLGCAALTISSLPNKLHEGWGFPGLVIAMILIGLGAGGFKVVVVPFMIDQYRRRLPTVKRLENGSCVVTDYEQTVQFICALHYWIGNVGSLSWFATVYIEKHHTFSGAYGFGLATIFATLLVIVFSGKFLVRLPAGGTILLCVGRIILCACRHGFRLNRAHPTYQSAYFRRIVPWSAQLVADVSHALQACRVLLGFVTFYVCFDQMQNNLISQAGQLRTDGTPNDLLPAMNQVGCIVFAPIASFLIYPQLARRNIYPNPVERIVLGFIFVTISMLWATILQLEIYKTSTCHESPQPCATSGVSVWLQAPVYLFLSVGEVFALTAGSEYAYSQAPEGAKVVVQAISSMVAALGSAIAMSLTPVAHDPNLTIFYASLAGAMAVTTTAFWLLFHDYVTHQSDEGKAGPSDEASESHQSKIPDAAPQIRPIGSTDPIKLFDIGTLPGPKET